MKDKMQFSISHYDVLLDDPYIMLLDTYIVSEGENRNGSYFSLEAIENAIPTLPNKPVICIWDDKDFKGHATNPLEFKRQDIVGAIPETSNIEIVELEGKKFLKATSLIWKAYMPHIADKLAKNEVTDISMEIVTEQTEMREDGLLDILKFRFMGISLLGEKQNPGIEYANVKVSKFSIEDFNKAYKIFTETHEMPEMVKENVTYALENLEQKNSNIVDYSKGLLDKECLMYNEITELFSKINNSRKVENISFYGGEEGRKWCADLIMKMEGGIEVLENEEKVEEVKVDETEIKVEDVKIDETDVKVEVEDVAEVEVKDVKEDESNDEEDDKEEEAENKEEFSTMGNIVEILREKVEELEADDYGFGRYMYADNTEDAVYVLDFADFCYYKMGCKINEGMPMLEAENKIRVYRCTSWMEEGSDNGADSLNIEIELEARQNEIYSKLDDAKTLKETNENLEKEVNELKVYKEEKEMNELAGEASDLYEKYESYLSKEDKESLDSKLYELRNMESFTKEVRNIVLPKMEAQFSLIKETKTDSKDEVKFAVLTNTHINTDKAEKKLSAKDRLKENLLKN